MEMKIRGRLCCTFCDKISKPQPRHSSASFKPPLSSSTERLSRPTIFHDHSTPLPCECTLPTPIARQGLRRVGTFAARAVLRPWRSVISERPRSLLSLFSVPGRAQRTLCDTLSGSSDNLPVRAVAIGAVNPHPHAARGCQRWYPAVFTKCRCVVQNRMIDKCRVHARKKDLSVTFLTQGDPSMTRIHAERTRELSLPLSPLFCSLAIARLMDSVLGEYSAQVGSTFARGQ